MTEDKTTLSTAEVDAELPALEGWRRDGIILARDFVFANFKDITSFLNHLTRTITEQNHHPDFFPRYRQAHHRRLGNNPQRRGRHRSRISSSPARSMSGGRGAERTTGRRGPRTQGVSPYEKRLTPRPLDSPAKQPEGDFKNAS